MSITLDQIPIPSPSIDTSNNQWVAEFDQQRSVFTSDFHELSETVRAKNWT